MQTYLLIYACAVAALGIYALLTTIFNLRFFRRMASVSRQKDEPLISVVIPARNEEENLDNLLSSICAQSYRNIEILVIDDQSSDRTGEIIKEYEERDGRVRGFRTDAALRLNQNGKINALLQVIGHAKGEYILATDADTIHEKDCIRHAYSIMRGNGLDIISGFPTELCPSFMGAINMSAMMFTGIFIPHYLVYKFHVSAASFAIGQFIMMRRDAYEETGGYSNIEGSICDDVGIVRLFVKNHKRYAFISICDYVKCNMYGSSKDSFRGIERSIAGVFPPKLSSLPPVAILITLLMHMALAPLMAILFCIVLGPQMLTALMLAGWLVLCLAWLIACRKSNWSWGVSLCFSLTLIMVSAMYIHGLCVELFGKGFEWKGRRVK